MSELNYKQDGFSTGNESEDDLRAATHELKAFKEQYEALSNEEKARLPSWVIEYIEKKLGSN